MGFAGDIPLVAGSSPSVSDFAYYIDTHKKLVWFTKCARMISKKSYETKIMIYACMLVPLSASNGRVTGGKGSNLAKMTKVHVSISFFSTSVVTIE